jgi:hypothetical protein
MDRKKSAMSQFFIIKAELPVKGIVSPLIEFETNIFFIRANKCPSADALLFE